MAGFNNYRDIVDAYELGQRSFFTWRKNISAGSQGIWFDTSTSPGNPSPNYYAATPLTSIAFSQADSSGLYHGGNVSPKTKYLKRFSIMSSAAGGIPFGGLICDYLLYYPFVTQDSTDPVDLINTVSLPRYTDGEGVKIMMVMQGACTGSPTFTVSYTNSAGVAGRTTTLTRLVPTTVTGNIVTATSSGTNSASPFLPLQEGDTGVRSVESLTMVSAVDIGLMAVVLVKPLTTISHTESTACSEIDFARDRNILPIIKDDAYLGMLFHSASNYASNNFHGTIETIWI